MEKKCKVVPIKNDDGVLCRCPSEESKDDIMLRESIDDFEFILEDGGSFEHLYILSDEEIKIGDWVYIKDAFDTEHIQQVTEIKDRQLESSSKVMLKSACKKIIISTDPSLNLSRPSNEFLKAYCREGGIDEVMVEFEMYCPRCEVNGFNVGCTEVHIPRLKIAPDNTVTIRKVKDSWSKEEVKKLCYEAYLAGHFEASNKVAAPHQANAWLKENL